mmetsp:Transcript_13899/g.25113  ORF Transcript_13899/g.25113 Transcript_13899/m.25113 type:complete len:200 (-) Transcript_13899:176-775(-)
MVGEILGISWRGTRIGSNILPLKQHLLPTNPTWQTILKREILCRTPLSPRIHAPLGIHRIGIHGWMPSIRRLGMNQILNKVQFIPLKLFRSRTARRISIINHTSPNLHMPIMMRIQITIHPHYAFLIVCSLGKPWHGSAVLIEPSRGGFVVVDGGLAAHAEVGVETVLAVFAGGAAGASLAFAAPYNVVGVPVAGAGGL